MRIYPDRILLSQSLAFKESGMRTEDLMSAGMKFVGELPPNKINEYHKLKASVIQNPTKENRLLGRILQNDVEKGSIRFTIPDHVNITNRAMTYYYVYDPGNSSIVVTSVNLAKDMEPGYIVGKLDDNGDPIKGFKFKQGESAGREILASYVVGAYAGLFSIEAYKGEKLSRALFMVYYDIMRRILSAGNFINIGEHGKSRSTLMYILAKFFLNKDKEWSDLPQICGMGTNSRDMIARITELDPKFFEERKDKYDNLTVNDLMRVLRKITGESESGDIIKNTGKTPLETKEFIKVASSARFLGVAGAPIVDNHSYFLSMIIQNSLYSVVKHRTSEAGNDLKRLIKIPEVKVVMDEWWKMAFDFGS